MSSASLSRLSDDILSQILEGLFLDTVTLWQTGDRALMKRIERCCTSIRTDPAMRRKKLKKWPRMIGLLPALKNIEIDVVYIEERVDFVVKEILKLPATLLELNLRFFFASAVPAANLGYDFDAQFYFFPRNSSSGGYWSIKDKFPLLKRATFMEPHGAIKSPGLSSISYHSYCISTESLSIFPDTLEQLDWTGGTHYDVTFTNLPRGLKSLNFGVRKTSHILASKSEPGQEDNDVFSVKLDASRSGRLEALLTATKERYFKGNYPRNIPGPNTISSAHVAKTLPRSLTHLDGLTLMDNYLAQLPQGLKTGAWQPYILGRSTLNPQTTASLLPSTQSLLCSDIDTESFGAIGVWWPTALPKTLTELSIPNTALSMRSISLLPPTLVSMVDVHLNLFDLTLEINNSELEEIQNAWPPNLTSISFLGPTPIPKISISVLPPTIRRLQSMRCVANSLTVLPPNLTKLVVVDITSTMPDTITFPSSLRCIKVYGERASNPIVKEFASRGLGDLFRFIEEEKEKLGLP